MARYNVPQNIYGDPFTQALSRLEDTARDIFTEERERKSEAEREYRATMASVMMKNAPHINWASFGNMIEDQNSFQSGANVYQDWLTTHKKAADFSPDGTVLSSAAASDLSPGIDKPYVDKTVLGTTSSDVEIMHQWITGEGDQARSMGWDGLINQTDVDGNYIIDDGDLFEMQDIGLVREGESWEDARDKIKTRWSWWKNSYKRENESYQGINEYAELEKDEAAKRTAAMADLVSSDPDYSTNQKFLNNINGVLQASVIQNFKVKSKDENDVLQSTPTDFYTNISVPGGTQVFITKLGETEGELTTIKQSTIIPQMSVSDFNQSIAYNQHGGNQEWAMAALELKRLTAISTVDELVRFATPDRALNNQRPLDVIGNISQAAVQAANNIIQKGIQNKNKEEQFGVSNYRSISELKQESVDAATAMDGIKFLNIDIGADNPDMGHPGMIQAFAKDMQDKTNFATSGPMIKNYAIELALKVKDGDATIHEEWIYKYLRSLSSTGSLEEGLFNHLRGFGQ